jgi:hypothetical protein
LAISFSLAFALASCFAKAFSIVFFVFVAAGFRALVLLLDLPDLFLRTILEPASASSRSWASTTYKKTNPLLFNYSIASKEKKKK